MKKGENHPKGAKNNCISRFSFFIYHFSFRQKDLAGHSLDRLARRRFLRNPLAVASLSVIGFFLLVAILGYLITPDHRLHPHPHPTPPPHGPRRTPSLHRHSYNRI